MSSVRVVQTATTRILRHRFPGASETVGEMFKFVWSLHWKINAVCMLLSSLVSFKSRFVTYLLNFPRIADSSWITLNSNPCALNDQSMLLLKYEIDLNKTRCSEESFCLSNRPPERPVSSYEVIILLLITEGTNLIKRWSFCLVMETCPLRVSAISTVLSLWDLRFWHSCCWKF